jgi:hypothetical protein
MKTINNYDPGTPARNFIETGLSETFATVLRRVHSWMTLVYWLLLEQPLL